jgi:O-methyltransferase involved in polyketide biosynthesis
VVIIAAGYDTRAYRLGKPGVKFYEIDLQHASEKKQELVKKHMPAEKVRHSLMHCLRIFLPFLHVNVCEVDLPHARQLKMELVKKHMPAEKVRHLLSTLSPSLHVCCRAAACKCDPTAEGVQ